MPNLLIKLQQSHGNQAVAQLVAMQRAGTATAQASMTIPSSSYVQKFAAEIVRDLMAEMTAFTPPTGSPFASWKPTGSQLFLYRALLPFKDAGAGLNQLLDETLGFYAVKDAVNRGRGEADLDVPTGPPTYNNAVALELRRLLSAQVAASMAYLGPRYVAARNQVALRQEALRMSGATTEPAIADVVPSQPLDRYLIPSFVQDVLEVDFAGYRKADPSELTLHQRKRRDVQFRFETDRGLKSWILVSSPLDPTPEEVAKELYGDPAHASDLVVATPRFGFKPRMLVGSSKEFWESLVHMPFGGDPQLYGIDPMKELLASSVRDEVALDQARNLKRTGATPDQVVDRLRLMSKSIQDSLAGPSIFGFDPRIDQLKARQRALDERARTLKAGGSQAEAARWDAQSAEQLDIMTKAADGVSTATTVAQGFHVTPADRDKIYSLPHYVWGPLSAVMMAYVDVLLASDVTAPARRLLAAADERSQTFPIDMMEGILEYLRAQLEPAANQTGSSPAIPGDVGRARNVQLREHAMRERLVGLRERIRSDPTSVQAELRKLQFELDNLQAETVATANIAAVNDMWSTLYDHISSWGVVTGKNDEYSEKMDRLNFWYLAWRDIVALIHEGSYDKAKTRLYLLQKDDRFGQDLLSMASLLRDRENVEMWIDLVGKLTAMIAIGILTAGVGTYVEGMLVTGAGWSAAGLGTIAVVSGAEASFFTAVNVALFEKDPTITGVLAQLGENFLMFGAMRGISVGYSRFVGEAFAQSPAGKLLGGAVQLETAALTSLLQKYVHAKIEGRDLTKAEARQVVLESLAFTVGMAVAARCFEPFMKGLRTSGASAYRSLFGEVDAIRRTTARQALALANSGRSAGITKVLDADAAAMKKENAVLEEVQQRATDPKASASERLSAPELEQVRTAAATGRQAYAGNRRAAALTGLPQLSGNRFVCSEGQLEPRVKMLTDKDVGFKEQSRVVDPISGRPTVELVNAGEVIRLTETSGSAEAVVASPERAAAASGGGPVGECFVAGTVVDGVEGPLPIETIAAGDRVIATDPATGRRTPTAVLRAYERTVYEVLDLEIGDQRLTCSPQHPFWIPGRRWITAGNLAAGDLLLTRTGQPALITMVTARSGTFTVHNLEVAGAHTFGVGELGILVHNKPVRVRMSPELAARYNNLVASGADPRAVRQFEQMFVSMSGDSPRMIEALNRIEATGHLVATLVKQSQSYQRQLDYMLTRTREKLAGDSGALQAIDAVRRLEASGRVFGFNDWLVEAAPRSAEQVRDMVAELDVVLDLYSRQAYADPNLIIRYGQDAKRSGKSFDITLENRSTGDVIRSIDAKRTDPARLGTQLTYPDESIQPGPRSRSILGVDEIRNQITAAAEKIPGAARGSTKEAAIFVDLVIGQEHRYQNGNLRLLVGSDLNYTVEVVATRRIIDRGNLREDLAQVFNNPRGRAAGIEGLDAVTLYDRNGVEIGRAQKAATGVWYGVNESLDPRAAARP